MIFIVFRNLTLALLLFCTLFSNAREGASIHKKTSHKKLHQDTIFVTGDFQVSKVFLLSSCFLLNHWFMNIMGAIGLHGFFLRFAALENNACNCTKYILLSCYLWCANPDREPPDKFPDEAPFTNKFHHYFYDAIYFIEDIIQQLFAKEINITFWTSFFLAQLPLKQLRWFSSHQESNCKYLYETQSVHTYRTDTTNRIHRLEGRTLQSNVVLSYTTKMKNEMSFTDPLPLDVDCYQFVIDTGTTFHICKNKNLFVDGIKKARNIWIKGVGGRIKVKGYGTIKIRVTDDASQDCDLVIGNVLYVPESPTNLLSPQLWSDSSSNKIGTGEMTIGGVTMLFWDNHKHTMMVPHHPELKLPIIVANDGNAINAALMTKKFVQPSMPQSLNTSVPIVSVDNNGTESTHIVPLDDEEQSIHQLQPSERIVIVDEMDMLNKPRIIHHQSTIPRHPLHIIQDKDDSTLNEQDASSLEYSEDTTLASESSLLEEESVHTNEECGLGPHNIDIAAQQMVGGMTEDQKLWLRYHYNLKHLPKAYMKRLAEQGIIPKRLAKIEPPICVACLKGKQHKTPWRGRGKKVKTIRKPHQNFPGAQTSTDQMISPHGGMIPQMRGKLMKAKYYAATIFVDHHTDYTYAHLMRDTTTDSTLEAKHAYEALLLSYGHRVRAYHGDNGRYAEPAFQEDAKRKSQGLTFCGSGQHSQNGIAENRIKQLCEDARTMLTHGMHMWPNVINKALWPYALKASCRARNKFKLDEDGLSPEMKMAGTQMHGDLRHEHPLFCPVFVLDRRLQSGHNIMPKWDPRSNAGVYLGHSPQHASNVALVLNLATGCVSPQYHVVFDDTFSTVEYITNNNEPTNWEELCKHHTEDYHMVPHAAAKINNLQNEIKWLDDLNAENVSFLPTDPSASDPTLPSHRHTNDLCNEQDQEGANIATNDEESANEQVPGDEEPALESPDAETLDYLHVQATEGDGNQATNGRVRVQRQRRPTIKLQNDENRKLINLRRAVGHLVTSMCVFGNQSCLTLQTTMQNRIKTHEWQLNFTHEEILDLNVDYCINNGNPLCLVAKSGKNDTFHFHDAMQQDDRHEFIKAMIKELDEHHKNKHWRLVPRKQIGKAKTLKAIWAFKRKRRPDGSLLKYKARLNAHGGMQVYGETYWDTYAPVVNWISIRMMLTLSIIHNLHTTSIDFTLAFPQADVDATIYMEVPLGCEVPEGDYVCLLLKNLYGLKQAAKTWFEHLRDTLILDEALGGYGFVQSQIDPCIFFKESVILISWVDDCLIFGKSKEVADKVIQDLHNKFTLTEEGDVSAYLGVVVDINQEDDSISLTQPYLIDRIIAELGGAISEANVKSTPSVYKEILHKDTDGPERKQSWNYRSVIGMLNYLSASTRPDILFAVHQCARFAANPKLSHERAVKRIVRYLKGTKNNGLILRPNPQDGIKCYVDADFAGGYSEDTRDDPRSVYSRTGYVIIYYACPVLWVSKMQTEISLSTVEAEYVALSTAMPDLLPFVDQVKELADVFGNDEQNVKLHCTLFEDNNGALELATTPRYRPRTKHIAVKYHHFRERVKNGTVKIEPIDTNEQLADQFTKGLQVGTFRYLRSKLLGW